MRRSQAPASAPIDTIHVQNPVVICECTLFFHGLYPDLEPNICSVDLINLGSPTTDPRGDVTRRKQIWQRAAGPHIRQITADNFSGEYECPDQYP